MKGVSWDDSTSVFTPMMQSAFDMFVLSGNWDDSPSIFTHCDNVLDTSGKTVSVRDALAFINQTLDEILAEWEGEFDSDTRVGASVV